MVFNEINITYLHREKNIRTIQILFQLFECFVKFHCNTVLSPYENYCSIIYQQETVLQNKYVFILFIFF